MTPTQRTNKTLFWLALSLPTIALLAMSWLVHVATAQFSNSFNWVARTYKVLDLVEQTQSHAVEAETSQRGYLLTGRGDYFGPYQTAMASLNNDIRELKNITQDNSVEQAKIAELENLITQQLSVGAQKAPVMETNAVTPPVIALMEQSKKTVEQLRAVLIQMRQEEQRLLNERQKTAEADAFSSQIVSFVLIGAVAIALIFIVFILLRLEKLQQFVTVCAWTGQVEHEGKWMRLDEYLHSRFGLSISHSLSKEAAEKMRLEIEALNRSKNNPSSTPPRAV